MIALTQAFEERLQEIETYLDFLDGVEKQIQKGPPRLGDDGLVITAQQQKILYSSVYLQLYNLVEATISRCVDALSQAVVNSEKWLPVDLSIELRREWVRFTAKTHIDRQFDKRLIDAVKLCDGLIEGRRVDRLKITKGNGGNWDDDAIDKLTTRLGLPLRVRKETVAPIKRHHKNEKGALSFIKITRNSLAHGNISFAECGEGVTVEELRELTKNTSLYLREVAASFQTSIELYEFLAPERRPEAIGA